jgi:hypothetical protein
MAATHLQDFGHIGGDVETVAVVLSPLSACRPE